MESPEFVPESSEIGSLTAHSNEDSQFVGSSSGVYFINTVKRAFSNGLDASGSSTADFPTAEDTLVGAEDLTRAKRPRTASSQTDHALSAEESESPAKWTYDPAVAAALGSAPPLNLAKDLMIMYFKVWHPLFPFLHGPTFLQAMQSLYSSSSSPKPSAAEPPLDHHRSSCWTTILQCVFNLGSLLRPELPLSPACKIQSPASISSLLGSLSSCHDIMSLQALLAAQVYLVAIMSLRPASTVGGCVLRCMFHAGLHRCPFRYRELSSHDRQLRKRIFWCAYAIDRYLSQALGLPLGIQDSDIDVCLPAAREIHSPRRTRSTVSDTQAANTAMAGYFEEQQPSEHETNGAGDGQPSRSVHRATGDEHQSLTPGREGVLASYVGSGTLTGRALELFHKSILVRSVRRSSVLFLVTDVHKWWNNLPLDLQGKNIGKKHDDFSTTDISFDFGPFFTVLYQHLILIIHRPSLSIDPSTAEFCSGLQTCIGAARAILFALRAQVASRQALFWPGFLSAAWMSGLVLAFACQLNQYVLAKGLQEIDECSEYLRLMSTQWETAKQCHNALSVLSMRIGRTDPHRESAANSQAYATRSLERHSTSNDHSVIVQQHSPSHRLSQNETQQDGSPSAGPSRRARQHSPSQLETLHPSLSINPDAQTPLAGGYGSTSIPAGSADPAGVSADVLLTETPSSLELNFQNADSDPFPGGSNFDLNMANLLQGANFDSLFDITGQQYPSF